MSRYNRILSAVLLTATAALATGAHAVSSPQPVQAASSGGEAAGDAVAGSAVSVYLSLHDGSQLLAAQPSVPFAAGGGAADSNTVVVDSAQRFQSMEGFGAAFTDSAAYLLNEVAQKDQLQQTLSDLFTRRGDGIGISFMRNPMGASDLARNVYTFDDLPLGQSDPGLEHFSIAHDQADIIPLIRQAIQLNPQMKLLATPWSPPAWMKAPPTIRGGWLVPTEANKTSFANYFVRYLEAYGQQGIHFDYLSIQNEPFFTVPTFPSMRINRDSYLELLRDYVLPALARNNLPTRVLIFDHDWDLPGYPEYVLSHLPPQQMQQVAGTAWHGYLGTPGAQQNLQNEFPALGAWMTELSDGTWQKDQFVSDFLTITQVVRNSAKAYVKWSLALDETHGPNLTQTEGLGNCSTCTPIVVVNSKSGAITRTTEYYTLGQYSRYVLPGAVRIYSSNTPALATVAFANPDGTTALVAFNNSTAEQSFRVQWGGDFFAYTLPVQAAATFTWGGTQAGRAAIAATGQIQGSSFSEENGLETENTADATGQYDLGFIAPGAYAVYRNVDFGSGVCSLQVRTASKGEGGQAAFYLDQKGGTPIAQVSLPVTGGWQSWQTVTAAAGGASGTHDLYVVFTGGGLRQSIANLNWFQFAGCPPPAGY